MRRFLAVAVIAITAWIALFTATVHAAVLIDDGMADLGDDE